MWVWCAEAVLFALDYGCIISDRIRVQCVIDAASIIHRATVT